MHKAVVLGVLTALLATGCAAKRYEIQLNPIDALDLINCREFHDYSEFVFVYPNTGGAPSRAYCYIEGFK